MFERGSAVCGKSAGTVGMQDISLIIAMPVTPRKPRVPEDLLKVCKDLSSKHEIRSTKY